MRGFYTNPSRADDSFIPFISKFSTLQTNSGVGNSRTLTAQNDYKAIFICVVANTSTASPTDITINGESHFDELLLSDSYGMRYLNYEGKANDKISVTTTANYCYICLLS